MTRDWQAGEYAGCRSAVEGAGLPFEIPPSDYGLCRTPRPSIRARTDSGRDKTDHCSEMAACTQHHKAMPYCVLKTQTLPRMEEYAHRIEAAAYRDQRQAQAWKRSGCFVISQRAAPPQSQIQRNRNFVETIREV